MRDLTADEMGQLDAVGITSDDMAFFWDQYPDQEFFTAIQGAVNYKQEKQE